jgi:hypothetical protein
VVGPGDPEIGPADPGFLGSVLRIRGSVLSFLRLVAPVLGMFLGILGSFLGVLGMFLGRGSWGVAWDLRDPGVCPGDPGVGPGVGPECPGSLLRSSAPPGKELAAIDTRLGKLSKGMPRTVRYTIHYMMKATKARYLKPQRLISLSYREEEERALAGWWAFDWMTNLACFRLQECVVSGCPCLLVFCVALFDFVFVSGLA